MNDTTRPAIELNPEPVIEVRPIGTDGGKLFICDNVLLDPDALVDMAALSTFVLPPDNSFYPGVTAPIPPLYAQLISSALREPMTLLFGMSPTVHVPAFGFFGLTTLGASAMSPAQTAPHTDAVRQHSFATVHYLSRNSTGGTAFYRHKSTGTELVSPIRSAKYAHFRRQELAQNEGAPLSVIRDLYEEIDYVEPKYNRLIFYRAGQLHSARLNHDAALTRDPRTGRLTANMFFNTIGL